jgi:hypothetical protein
VRLLYVQVRERCRLEDVDLVLIETLRDELRQAHYIATNVSWTTRSKHLPQAPHGLALAFDCCPRDYLDEKDWAPGASQWLIYGDIGLSLGLQWGGLWRRRDYPHLMLDECLCEAPAALEA